MEMQHNVAVVVVVVIVVVEFLVNEFLIIVAFYRIHNKKLTSINLGNLKRLKIKQYT